MPPLRELSFEVGPVPHDDRDALAVTPLLDGVRLVDLVTDFERRQGHSPAGGYAGIVPSSFRFGDLRGYFLGRNDGQWPEPGRLWLLGCDCGEAGCWPLEAQVAADERTVTWTAFTQPHRDPERDYSGFGPFVFDRTAYDHAVSDLVGRC